MMPAASYHFFNESTSCTHNWCDVVSEVFPSFCESKKMKQSYLRLVSSLREM